MHLRNILDAIMLGLVHGGHRLKDKPTESRTATGRQVMSGAANKSISVIAGHSASKTRVNALMPGNPSIFARDLFRKGWMRGSSPRMTVERVASCCYRAC